MRRLEMVLAGVAVSAVIGTFALNSARAQPFPTPIKPSVEARIAALEQKVAVLESQNAELRGVIQISSSAGSVTIKPTGQLALKGATVVVESSGTAEIKASGTMSLKGSRININ